MAPVNSATIDIVVKRSLDSWTALRLALEHGFVEGNVEEKCIAIKEDLTHLCAQGADQLDIEELLESAAYHDFNFLDEDKSFKDLARAIVTCLRELTTDCVQIEVIDKHFPSVSAALSQSRKGEDQIESVDEESALSEMISESTLEEPRAPKPKAEPIIDDDGFELVQPRRKR